MSFFQKRTRVQIDTRSHTERTRDHYMGMEVKLQNRIASLQDTIKSATADLEESEAILHSVHAAQEALDKHITKLIDMHEAQIEAALADFSVDVTDPTMPMGENGNSRVD